MAAASSLENIDVVTPLRKMSEKSKITPEVEIITYAIDSAGLPNFFPIKKSKKLDKSKESKELKESKESNNSKITPQVEIKGIGIYSDGQLQFRIKWFVCLFTSVLW